jgi:hypothetical protein
LHFISSKSFFHQNQRGIYSAFFTSSRDRRSFAFARKGDLQTAAAPPIHIHFCEVFVGFSGSTGNLTCQSWTRDQYQQAFRDKPDTGAVYTVRTALSATQQTAQSPQEFTHTMQFLLKNFQQLSNQLRKVKPI